MNLKMLLLTKNDCYVANKWITPKGIMLHSTGANNPNLKRYIGPNDGLLGYNIYNNHWNKRGLSKCVHAFIGKLKDGSIASYQTLPWKMRGWHAGGSANNTHIGIEICEDGLKDAEYFNKVYREAAELCAHLCDIYNLDPSDPAVLLCHSEGYKLGIATNHSDVMHWFSNHGKTMNDFRKLVNSLVNKVEDISEELSVGDTLLFIGGNQYTSSDGKKGSLAPLHRVKITKIYPSGKYPYHVRAVDINGKFIAGVYGWVAKESLVVEEEPSRQVKVTASTLNIRSGPGTNYKIVGKIEDKGIYTIIEEVDGWGKLKSKVGWISLNYTKNFYK